jgi:hypothetical protein
MLMGICACKSGTLCPCVLASACYACFKSILPTTDEALLNRYRLGLEENHCRIAFGTHTTSSQAPSTST